MNVHSRPLKVAALGMKQRTYNILQLYLVSRSDEKFVLSDEKSADILIIDADSSQSSVELEVSKQKFPQKQLIVVSIKDNLEKGVLFVRKPIRLSMLTAALNEARQRIVQSGKHTQFLPNKPNNDTQSTPYSEEKKVEDKPVYRYSQQGAKNSGMPQFGVERHSSAIEITEKHIESAADENGKIYNNTSASKISFFENTERLKAIQEQSEVILQSIRENSRSTGKKVVPTELSKFATEFRAGVNDSGIRFIGDLSAIFNPRNPIIAEKLQYNVDVTLQGYVSLAYKIAITSACNVVLEGYWRPILILYNTREICVERDFRHLFALSAMSFKKEEVSIYGQEQNELTLQSDKMVVQPIEQFLWKLALRTSQGRIPIGTDLETPVRLIRWPNFTRYEVAPHAIRIAALWAKYPVSLLSTAKILKIPQQYVFAFYSAAHTTGMVKHEPVGDNHEIPEPPIADGVIRNMCQNLLFRLQQL